MRLLQRKHDGNFVLTEVLTDNIPKYAILSHTWLADEDEITYEDMTSGNIKSQASFKKIRFCVDQAHKDGLEYSWIDTCCIDRSSSAELQETITVMFSWYRNAEKCYVYMTDVSMDGEEAAHQNVADAWKQAFYDSRWFTRGWTLQELLAPNCVEFFCVQGLKLGDRKSLESYIHEITEIPPEALRGHAMTNFSVDERLSWARKRQTKRKEDEAYSLLGLFGIFMPLLYGEGGNAFSRLKREIDRKNREAARLGHFLASLPTVPQAAFDSLENQHEPTCLPNTRVELLREITCWIEGTDKRCVFWLNGIAGTGKSTIARTIAEKCHSQGHLGASFFFSRGGGDLAHADRLITTLAWQLATKIPRLKQYICEAIRDQEDVAATSLRHQWDHLIRNPLSRLDAESSPTTIVIVMDALDECDSERDIRIILRLLATTKLLKSICLRVFITSRPEIPVRCGFSQIPEPERQIFVLHDISPAVVNRDLRLFFEDSFTNIREERGFAIDWPGMQVLDCLVKISGGLFIWASTACRYIREGRRLALRRIYFLINGQTSGLGPEKRLDEIYIAVLRNAIQQGYNQEEKHEICEMIREVLGRIVVLLSPLSINSLANLLRRPSSDINCTLADMHAVLNIPNQKDRPIRLHHPSFRDFLLNKDRCSDLDFWVDEKQTHRALADDCVMLMSKMLKRDICSLKSPGILAKDIDASHIRKHVSPELRYACLHWIHHHREGGTQLRDGDRAHIFFQDHYLSWLEAMSLMGNMSEAAGMIRMYAALLTPSDNLRQLPFVQDARRYLFAFQSIIEHAPLQTYCAALAFSPRTNELRQHLWVHLQHWLRDVRIVEARTLKAQKPKSYRTFFVNDLAFTPDGRKLASGSVDKEIRLWDVATKTTLGKMEGHTDKISSVAVSADGLRIASASDDTTVMVWDWETRAVRYTLTGHSRWVNSVAFSPDGKVLASGSMDETVRLWSMDQGKELRIFGRNTSCVNSVTFSPDGTLIAAAAADRMIRLWNIEQGDMSLLLDGHSGPVNCVRFSPTGKTIVSGADDMTVKLWNTDAGTEYLTLKGHQRRVMTVAFSPNSHHVASGSEDSTVRLWDSRSGDLLAVLQGHTSGINAVVFSPDGQLLASSAFDNEVRLWDVNLGEPRGVFDDIDDDVMLSSRERAKARALGPDAAASKEVCGHSEMVTYMTFSRDGQLIASGSHDTTIKLWNRNATEFRLLEGHTGSINYLTFSWDNHVLASSSTDGTIKVWDTATGKLWYTLEGHANSVRLVRFSSDSQYLASCSTDKTAIIWDVGTGSISSRLEDHSDTVNEVAFSPNGDRVLATCSADHNVKLWDVSTGTVRHTLRGHTDTVNHIAFSPNGQLLVSSSADTTIRLWGTNGAAGSILKGHSLPVNSAAISPDGKSVVSCSDDGSVRLWDLETNLEQGVLALTVIIRVVRFSSCGRYIETDRGVLDTVLFFRESSLVSSGAPPMLFASKDWVRKGTENVLWLPDEFHATNVATEAELMILGHSNGSLSFLQF